MDFIAHMHPILMVFTKIMWHKMADGYEHYVTAILGNQMM